MSRSPDFQKREAKKSLRDLDGVHAKKKHRNKGKGRGKDKRLIREELKNGTKSQKLEPDQR